jgi:hypothetical protein
MDFKLQFILIVGACIINLFLFCISSIGFYMVIKSKNEWGYFLGCIFIMANSALQGFALASLLNLI